MVSEGDRVLLVSKRKEKTFLFKVIRGKTLHTHLGVIKADEIIGRKYGEVVKSSKDEEFYILYPLLKDRIMKVERRSAIIYPKDAALLIFLSGVSPGDEVIEAGVGSGAFTIALAHFKVKVHCYEIRDDFIELAKLNLKENGLIDFVEIKKRDVYREGFEEENVSAIFLDLPEPQHVVKFASKSLRPGGVITSVLPTFNQVEIFCETLRMNNFILIDTLEILQRKILVREGRTRPQENMISHTAFITIARKI